MTLHISSNVAGRAVQMTSNVLMHVLPFNESFIHGTISQEMCQPSGSESNVILNPHTNLIHSAMGLVPIVTKAATKIKDQVGSTITNLIAWQNPGECSSEQSEKTTLSHSRICDHGDLRTGELYEAEANTASKEGYEEQAFTRNATSLPKPIGQTMHFSVRICDLCLESKTDEFRKKRIVQLELQHDGRNQHLTEATDKMVERALFLSEDGRTDLNSIHDQTIHFISEGKTPSGSQPIQWKAEGVTSKLITNLNWHHCQNTDKIIQTLEKEVFIWSGQFRSKAMDTYGHKIPLLKGRGIVPNMTPRQLVDLLLDSSKVQLYNKFSNGRKDICIFENHLDGKVTKIVENQTQIPFSSKVIKILTFLHARPIDEGGGNDEFIVVSRSVEMALTSDDSLHDTKQDTRARTEECVAFPGERNEVMWGINILRTVPGYRNKVDLTTMTQANSSTVPGFLVQKVGLMCVNDFFKLVRKVPLPMT
jgi:tRNA(Ser,Leu) C12 N-acetylase TAN1